MTTIQIILLLVIAAITGMGSVLDEGQTHRPLVACTLVGWVLGDMTTGIILGGTLEMMALGWMNVGLAMAPDTAIASVISTILVINTNQGIGEGIAIAVALAAAGQALTIFVRTMTVFLIHRADTYAEKGNMRGIEIAHITALGFQALRVMIPPLWWR
jgi:mannose/fructose/N-acetylgalactosamine-specific phosphotransferase system component IIC